MQISGSKAYATATLVVAMLLMVVSASPASDELEEYRKLQERQRQEYKAYLDSMRLIWGGEIPSESPPESLSSAAEKSSAEESEGEGSKSKVNVRYDDEAYMRVLRSFWAEMLGSGRFKYHKYGSNHESDVDFDRGTISVEGSAEAPSLEAAIRQALDHVIEGTKESILSLGFEKGGTVEDRLEMAGLLSEENMHSFLLENMKIDEDAFDVEVGEGGRTKVRATAQTALLGKEVEQIERKDAGAEAVTESSLSMVDRAGFFDKIFDKGGESKPGAKDSDDPITSEETEITGLIVDASELNYRPMIAPEIVSTHWRKVYHIKKVAPEILAARGAADWVGSMEAAKRSTRAGKSPFVIKPLRISNRNALVIDKKDRTRILRSNGGKKALQEANVVIVIDPIGTGSIIASTEDMSVGTVAMQLPDQANPSVGTETEKNWHSLGPNEGGIQAMAIDPSDPEVLYVGCYGGVFKSTDGGRSWMAKNRGLPYPWIGVSLCNSIVIDTANTATLYVGIVNRAALEPGLYKSTDAAETWLPLGLPYNIKSIAVSSLGIVYAGTEYNGIYKSTDDREGWIRIGHEIKNVEKIRINPENPEDIYLLTHYDGFYVSRDAGETWFLSNEGLPDESFISLAVDPFDGDRLYAGVYSGDRAPYLYNSTDGGRHWEPIVLPEQNHYPSMYNLSDIVVSPQDSKVIYAALDNVIYKTTDRGVTWDVLKYVRPVDNRNEPYLIQCLAVGPDNWKLLFASTSSNFPSGLYKSVNAGNDWERIGVPAVQIKDFAAGRDLGTGGSVDRIYALSTVGFYRSNDGGESWEDLNATHGANVMAIDPQDNDVLLVGGTDMIFSAYIGRSMDGGDTFEGVLSSFSDYHSEGSIPDIEFDPHHNGRVYASILMYGVKTSLFFSVDIGETWTATDLPAEAYALSIAFDPLLADVLYVGAHKYGVLKSEDGGENWEFLWPEGMEDNIISLAIDSLDGQTLLAGSTNGLYRSADRGTTWKPVSEGLPEPGSHEGGIHNLAFDPDNAGIVYAGTTGGGVFISRDNGLSWTACNQGVDHKYIEALGFDFRKPHRLLAGTGGGGIYARVVTGQD